MGLINRYRHRKGFGVHSPFAFRFITEVIGESLPYYDYAHLSGRNQRLLYRVVNYFRPNIVKSINNVDLQPVLMAYPKAKITEGADFDMALGSGEFMFDTVHLDPDRRQVIFIEGRHKSVIACAKMRLVEAGYGMIFDNLKDIAIIVADPKLPRQDIEVAF